MIAQWVCQNRYVRQGDEMRSMQPAFYQENAVDPCPSCYSVGESTLPLCCVLVAWEFLMKPRFPHDFDGWAPRARFVSLSQYNVVLHRDPEQSLNFIIRAVMELTRFCKEEATIRMWEAYHIGRCVILATHLERAELYVEQFAERGLPTSIEPVC
ncbi:MAG: hypothetical protein EXS09_19480 [Gemmataceae bacterium]|nr:hypothetical protein [Gemmataceae bacterium]